MIIAIAAAQADFKTLEWFSNKGNDFKLKLSDHPAINVATDDLIGLKKTTRGPTAGSYQVVLAKYPQLVFRSISQKEIDGFYDKLKPYAGIPEKPEKTGKRMTPLVKASLEKNDKQTSQFYVSPRAPREQGAYDKDDYQWRQMVRGVRIVSKEHGKTRAVVKEHDTIGMRYLRKSHGGYVIVPTGERVMIAHDMYEELTLNSDILPHARQEKGIVDLNDIARHMPKGTRIRIPKLPKVSAAPKKVHATRGPTAERPFHEKNKPLISQFDYKEFDDAFDFEPDDEEFLLNPPDEFDLDDEETVNNQDKPALDTDLDDDDDDPDMDHLLDEKHDEETGDPIEDEDAVYAEEGLILKSMTGEEWVVVGIEEEGLSDTLLLYNPATKTLRNYRVAAGADLREMKTVTPTKVMSGPAYEKLREEAADRDLTAGKRI